MKTFTCIIASLILLSSCSHQQQQLIPSEYVRWVNNTENGLVLKKEIGEYEYTLKYQPVDYMIANEFRSDNIDAGAYEKRKKEMEGAQYYSLRIKQKNSNADVMLSGISSPGDYYAADNYLAFGFKDDIKMVQGDTVACSLYHFINTHGLTPHIEIIFGFNKPDNKGARTIVINERVFGAGTLKFSFSENVLSQVPGLKI